jgi:hypothetical protein
MLNDCPERGFRETDDVPVKQVIGDSLGELLTNSPRGG